MADARNVPYLIQYAQLLYHLKGEREKARQVAEEIRRIDPEHWWIIMYADKYLVPTQDTAAESPFGGGGGCVEGSAGVGGEGGGWGGGGRLGVVEGWGG